MEKDYKNNIRKIFWLYFILFVALQIYIFKFIVIDSKEIVTDSRNPRLSILNSEIKRGKIISSDKEIVAESFKEDGIFKRVYYFGQSFSQIIGNINYQKSGVEGKYNFKLQGMELGFFQRLNAFIFNDDLIGNDVELTLNAKLQKFSFDQLEKYKGSIVVLEPASGKIIAMASSPSYDPNKIENSWDELISDEKNYPLLNRSIKGLYPPGSVFKIVTATDIIRNYPDYENYFYKCTGIETFDGEKIRCYDSKAHGDVNLEKAFTFSCNTYFAHMSTKISNDKLVEVSKNLFFNKNYSFPLEYNQSLFSLASDSGTGETIQTAIGQGKTLMTPLHISLITAAIANDGVLMKPILVENFYTATGRKVGKSLPEKEAVLFSKTESIILKSLMRSVVTSGTGVKANVKNLEIAGKTGTAENSTGKSHALFTCFAPVENPEIVVTVVLENTEPSSKAVLIAKDIVNYYYEIKK